MTRKLTIQEVLSRQVAEVLPSKKGLVSLMKKRRIRLYLGIDPTGGNLHLGHAIALRKLQQFAGLGHEAILVVGTGTVLAGDPSQREEARRKITQKEIRENIATWKKQAGKILDLKKVKLRYNGDWLLKLTVPQLLEIASHISLAQLSQRDMFRERVSRGDTVWTHEALYPLLQGYDSVVLKTDLEIGGTDQVFNMLMGRELMRKMSSREKFVLTVPMVLGLDGKTMSKTSGNTVNLADSPKDMYGKLMTLRDELMPQYFELCTDIPKKEAERLKKKLSARDLKARLAREIVALYHGAKKAEAAEKEFIRVFQKGQLPSSMQRVRGLAGKQALVDILVKTKLVLSKSQARRLIKQGGVKIDGVQQKEGSSPELRSGSVIQVGKRRFVRVA